MENWHKKTFFSEKHDVFSGIFINFANRINENKLTY